MKKKRFIPAILMLMLCVAVLCMGIYAAAPVSNTISGTITVQGAGYEVGVRIYRVNPETGLKGTELTDGEQKSKGVIEDLSLGNLTFDVGPASILSDVPTKRFIVEVKNYSSVELGVYFKDPAATPEMFDANGYLIKEAGAATSVDFKNQAGDITYATAYTSYYKHIMPTGSTVKPGGTGADVSTDAVEMYVDVSCKTLTEDTTEPLNITLEMVVEKYEANVKWEGDGYGSYTSSFTNGQLLKLVTSYPEYDTTNLPPVATGENPPITTIGGDGLSCIDFDLSDSELTGLGLVLPQTVTTMEDGCIKGNSSPLGGNTFVNISFPIGITSFGGLDTLSGKIALERYEQPKSMTSVRVGMAGDISIGVFSNVGYICWGYSLESYTNTYTTDRLTFPASLKSFSMGSDGQEKITYIEFLGAKPSTFEFTSGGIDRIYVPNGTLTAYKGALSSAITENIDSIVVQRPESY